MSAAYPTRLQLSVLMQAKGLSYTELAKLAGVARSSLYALASKGIWPARTDSEALAAALCRALRAKGVQADELVGLFELAEQRPRRSHRLPSGGSETRNTASTNPESTEEDQPMLLDKQSLRPEARRQFKLFANPFDGDVTKDEMMFVGSEFAYVREAAFQCALTGGFVAVCGESGAGKTTVLADLQARLEKEPRKVLLIKPDVLSMEKSDAQGTKLMGGDIVFAIINQLDPHATVPQTMSARTAKARKMLTVSAQMNNSHLVVIEEAHSMPDSTLRHLKRLHELRDGRRPLLGILLLGQPELRTRLIDGLRNGTLREVAQRCEVVELLPLDHDLKPYLKQRAEAFNVDLPTLMDDDAIEQLRKRLTVKDSRTGKVSSVCYPLMVNNMVTRALNKAADLGEPIVTRDVVDRI